MEDAYRRFSKERRRRWHLETEYILKRQLCCSKAGRIVCELWEEKETNSNLGKKEKEFFSRRNGGLGYRIGAKEFLNRSRHIDMKSAEKTTADQIFSNLTGRGRGGETRTSEVLEGLSKKGGSAIFHCRVLGGSTAARKDGDD